MKLIVMQRMQVDRDEEKFCRDLLKNKIGWHMTGHVDDECIASYERIALRSILLKELNRFIFSYYGHITSGMKTCANFTIAGYFELQKEEDSPREIVEWTFEWNYYIDKELCVRTKVFMLKLECPEEFAKAFKSEIDQTFEVLPYHEYSPYY